jgi:hypothetical protein
MTGTLGGLTVDLTREDLLWLVQNSNGNGKHELHYGEPLPEPHAPMDELTAIEENLNKREANAFVDQEDLVNEARAARAAAYAAFALNGAAQTPLAGDDPHEGVPVSAPVSPTPDSPAVPTPIPGAF